MLLSSIFPLSANAYAPSGTLEYRFHNGFSEPIYAYSSLFRTGRDNFHWLDFAYSETNYQLDDEVGRAMGYSSIYKFAQRQRWHRFFKPAIFVGVGLHRRELTKRNRVSNGLLEEGLDNKFSTGGIILLGGGYLWEVKNMVIGFSLSYGYDFSYAGSFYSPAFIFSYQL